MNYLGHSFLSFGNSEILVGNMIGDHVKGRLALEQYPPLIRKGIELHRKIDATTDCHPAAKRASLLFREDYGLYAPAIMDTLFDHFLANDAKYFSDEPALLRFSQNVYAQLENHQEFFPEKFAAYFPFMKSQNWLYNYRTVRGMERSLNGLRRRASNMQAIDKAYQIFVVNYYQLNQCYYELIDDVISFVKKEL
jgi:acyl carrier protein phosphodiesterase